MQDERIIRDMIADSPWRNSYFYARDLLNTDKYGAIGHKKELMLDIIAGCETILQRSELTEYEKFGASKKLIESKIRLAHKTPKQIATSTRFLEQLDKNITSVEDLIVFIITAKYVVLPANEALQKVPSSDKEFCEDIASSILSELGPAGVGKVVAIWDDLGTNGCLSVERGEVVTEFTKLKSNLEAMRYSHTSLDENIVLTAFIQEFERRLGQKRKTRAGSSLEDVASFLFRYYEIKAVDKPEHFQSDIEVDKWFKCADGWLVGISCKHTLRERWKQVSSASVGNIGIYHVKEVWHLLTYDTDLSDDKIAMLGRQNQFFYLQDDSPRYKDCKDHPVLSRYVRPLSNFVGDIYRLQNRNPHSQWNVAN